MGPAADRADRLQQLFGEAADLPEPERAAFVARECDGDEALARELLSLLAFDPGPTKPDALAETRPDRRGAANSEPPSEPLTLGRFEVQKQLGEGGMGVVYLARDPTLARTVALKVVKGAGSPALRTRLMREAQAMARITHPNVVTVHEVGLDGSDVFIAMEHVEGETLSRWLATPRTQREILAMFLMAGRGLAAAHRAGLLHRDFKPANVLVGRDGRARVLDFGLARQVDDATSDANAPNTPWSALDVNLTHAGAIMGTPGFMSPEHFEGGVGPASDQWSFAAALYQALYHRLPFGDLPLMELKAAVLDGAPEPPRSGDHVLPEVERAVMRALSRYPVDRFASLEEMCDVIEDAVSVDPEQDDRRFLAQRKKAMVVLFGLTTANVILGGLRTDFRYDFSLQGLVLQLTVGMVFLLVVAWLFRRSVFALRRNRSVLALILTGIVAIVLHRLYAITRDLQVVDVLRTDAIFMAALLTFGGFALDRWLYRGALAFVAYLVLTGLEPRLIEIGFGLSLLTLAMLGAWSWPLTPPGRVARAGDASSSGSGRVAAR